MDRRTRRGMFWMGLLIYAASFLVSFVGGRGAYELKPPSGADCAIDWFCFPWVYSHLHSMGSFLTDAPIQNVSTAISGWVNPLFLLAVFSVVGTTHQLTRVLRNVVLILLPFCWVVFMTHHLYPREGYFLWTIGILLTLFSTDLEVTGFVPANRKSVA